MAPHDSESSDDDGVSFTTTSVLLGYASKEPTDDTISQLGGQPVWLDPAHPPSAALARCKICREHMPLLLQLHGDLPEFFPGHERRLYIFGCRKKTCRRKEGCVRAIRSVRRSTDPRDTSVQKEEQVPSIYDPSKIVPTPNLGNTLFGVTTPQPDASNPFLSPEKAGFVINPFSPPPTTASPPLSPNPDTIPLPPSPSTYFALYPIKPPAKDLPKTFAQKLSLFSPPPIPKEVEIPEPWPPESGFPVPYPRYHLDADYESLEATPKVPIPPTTIDEMDLDDPKGKGKGKAKRDDEGNNSPSSSKAEKDDPDTFESTIDKTFQRFADLLAQNPLQVLRYEFIGTPLLYSKTDSIGMVLSQYLSKQTYSKELGYIKKRTATTGFGAPLCGNCGTNRAFELQLTPQTIMELEAEEDGLEGMEWGTIILGVCGKDCGGEGGVVESFEEWVGVQWEERGKS